ncbi:hypothetical protein ACTFIR_003844 [Dictyostelium discoideum]
MFFKSTLSIPKLVLNWTEQEGEEYEETRITELVQNNDKFSRSISFDSTSNTGMKKNHTDPSHNYHKHCYSTILKSLQQNLFIKIFGHIEGFIVKNDTDLLIVEKRINYCFSCQHRLVVSFSVSHSRQWRLRSIIPHSSRRKVRDFTLVNSSKPMEWKGNQSVPKLILCSHNRCLRIRCRSHSQEIKRDNQNLVIPVVNNSIEHVIKSSRNACAVNNLLSAIFIWESNP